MKNKNTEKIEFLKIVYFDEAAAQDYVDVTNGGRLDWSTQENKEKIAKIVAEIEAQAKSGFNILNYIKATFQGKVDASASAELTSAFDKTIKNTLLTDYIQAASKDEHVKKFENSGVYAPENSVTLYKMLSSYLTIVPKEEMPIDMEKLNEAILGERGYYDMLLKTEIERKSTGWSDFIESWIYLLRWPSWDYRPLTARLWNGSGRLPQQRERPSTICPSR